MSPLRGRSDDLARPSDGPLLAINGLSFFQDILRGDKKSYELRDWFSLYESEGGPRQSCFPEEADTRADAMRAQPDGIANMLEGKPHSLPTFREARRVQEIIERML